MAAVLIGATLALGWLFPATSWGRFVRRITIEFPARALDRLTFGRALGFVVLLTAFAALYAYARSEAAFLLGPGAPEAIGWFITFDVGSWIDVIALASMLAVTVRVKATLRAGVRIAFRFGHKLGQAMAAFRRTPRAQRVPRRRPAPKRSDDDVEGWRLAGRPALLPA